MAEPLKTFFDEGAVRRIARMLTGAAPGFPERRFIREASAGLDGLELMERARHIRDAMRRALPEDYEEAVEVLISSLGPELEHTGGTGMDVFLYLPHVMYVAACGLEHFEPSMRAQYELTKRFSAELSIRPFLERYPQETLARLEAWTRDPNAHVRRLVSEGTRPRLPWAQRLRAFQADPAPVLRLLERLKDDPVLYVRRSVANNLNDIGKDHPALLVEVCARWMKDATPDRRWVVKHALRSAIKRGDLAALKVLGFAGREGIAVEGAARPRRIPLGGEASVEVTVRNTTAKRQRVVLDLAVHFVKANGDARPKVFKLRALELPPGASEVLSKRISFAQLTTRTHYAGRHAFEVLVNGRAFPLGQVELVAGQRT